MSSVIWNKEIVSLRMANKRKYCFGFQFFSASERFTLIHSVPAGLKVNPLFGFRRFLLMGGRILYKWSGWNPSLLPSWIGGSHSYKPTEESSKSLATGNDDKPSAITNHVLIRVFVNDDVRISQKNSKIVEQPQQYAAHNPCKLLFEVSYDCVIAKPDVIKFFRTSQTRENVPKIKIAKHSNRPK